MMNTNIDEMYDNIIDVDDTLLYVGGGDIIYSKVKEVLE